MADFGSFLSNVALGAGQNIMYGQAQEERQAQLADLRSQTQSRQQNSQLLRDDFMLRQANAQRAQQMQEEKAKFLQNLSMDNQVRDTAEKSPMETALAQAQMAEKNAAEAGKRGYTAEAEEFRKQADTFRKNAQGYEKIVKERQTERVDKLGNAAQSVLKAMEMGGLTPEMVQEYDKARMDAGLPPFGGQDLDGKSGYILESNKGRAELTLQVLNSEKARKMREAEAKIDTDKEKADEARQYHQEIIRTREDRIKELATAREAKVAEKEAKAKGEGPMSVSEKRDINAVVGAAAEGARGLRIIAAMKPGQTAGAFIGLHQPGGIAEALSQVGARQITPQSQQMYETASTGMGLEIGRVLTLGGGRGVNQSTINELQKIIQVHPGDTEFTAMFKLANAADIIRNRLSTLPDSPTVKVREQQKATEELLKNIPLPEEVLAAAPPDAKANASGLVKQFATMGDAIKGTVKTGSGGLTPQQQSAIDKYLSK